MTRSDRTASSFRYRLASASASTALSDRLRSRVLSQALERPLDRVKVLGSDDTGHTGCVNALSWALDGDLLLSGGDDTTVRLWRMDPTDSSSDYPFVCQSVIRTGHTANIFNAQMLPFSTRIATVAGDRQVRVFDIGDAAVHSSAGRETLHTSRDTCIRVLKCHGGRVKRIVTEFSPDLFLTVAEDGAVRQHDLRTPHNCRSGQCPQPLVELPHDLSAIALSPLTPYQFVVAGESPYGYLFDRRQTGRILEAEWGVPPSSMDLTTCVRRFGRKGRAPGERRGYEHITGARMAASNGHEILLSYSSDAVYLYSTHDEPQDEPPTETSVLPANKLAKATTVPPDTHRKRDFLMPLDVEMEESESAEPEIDEEDREPIQADDDLDHVSAEDEDDDNSSDGEDGGSQAGFGGSVPIVLPHSSFTGHCNVETVKDVNFLGPDDEYIASGSDDGNFFMWEKSTGHLKGIFDGDTSVVNVIEPHPHLPLIAVSGIDTTVKLFAPQVGQSSQFSKISNVTAITTRNASAARQSSRRLDLAHFVLHYGEALSMLQDSGAGDTPSQCPNQ